MLLRFFVFFVLACFLFVPVVSGECSYSGLWDTDWGDMSLSQSGSSVSGDYTWDSGKIDGSASGKVMTGSWSESPTYSRPYDAGDVVFTMSGDCSSFTGRWAYGSSSNGWDGEWVGTRKTPVEVTSTTSSLKVTTTSTLKTGCGDGRCEGLEEFCYTCPKDCKCPKGTTCLRDVSGELGVSDLNVDWMGCAKLKEKPAAFPPYDENKNYCGPEGKMSVPRGHLLSKADFNIGCYNHDKCYGGCQTTCTL